MACSGPNPKLKAGLLLLQEKWTLMIIHRLLHGPISFNELNRQAEGVNATTLSQRLTTLEQQGLVVKTIHSTMPPRTSYELTDAGRDLAPALDAIERWSLEHMTDDDSEPAPGSCQC